MLLLTWLIFLPFYLFWLFRKRPHQRSKTYRFIRSGFKIELNAGKSRPNSESKHPWHCNFVYLCLKFSI